MAYFAICYNGKSKEFKVHGFIESIWTRDIDGRQSTSGYVFRLFVGATSWMRRKQFVVSLSTIEDEHIESTHENIEEVWLQQQCLGIGLEQEAVRLDCDG